MGAGPLVLYLITALAPLIVADLEFSRVALGALAAVTFVTAAVCAGVIGSLVDRYSERVVTVVVLLGSGAALLITAAAQGLFWLLVAGAVAGAAQSLSNPVTNRLLSVHAPANRLGILVGVKQSGVQLAQLLAGTLLPAIAVVAGWRTAAVCAAIAAMAALPLTRKVIPPAPISRSQGASLRQRPSAEVWWLVGYTFLTAAALQATNVYLPLFTHQSLGADASVAGLTAGVVGGVGVISRVLWGRVAGQRHNIRPLLITLAAVAACGVVLLAVAEILAQAWLVWPAAFLHGGSALASNAVVMVAVIRFTRGHGVGGSSGALACALYLGFAMGPLTFGFAVDSVSSYSGAWLATAATYFAALIVVCNWTAWAKWTGHASATELP